MYIYILLNISTFSGYICMFITVDLKYIISKMHDVDAILKNDSIDYGYFTVNNRLKISQ